MYCSAKTLRSTIFCSSLLLLSSLLTSCIYIDGEGPYGFSGGVNSVRGSGYSVTEVRQVSGFDRVRFDTQGELIIQTGDTESLVVDAEDNLQELWMWISTAPAASG